MGGQEAFESCSARSRSANRIAPQLHVEKFAAQGIAPKFLFLFTVPRVKI